MAFSIQDSTAANAFSEGKAHIKGPVESTGRDLFYHGNHIAQWKKDGLYISNGGYQPRNGSTGSLSTKFLLNALPGVNISTLRRQWSLNGKEWDGEEIKVKGVKAPKASQEEKPLSTKISLRTIYRRSDGWRGSEQPIFAAAGANDTGGWSDSPCPSNVATEELQKAAGVLRSAKIKYKETVAQTSNVFCVGRYLVVSEADLQKAKELVKTVLDDTRLLYIPDGPQVIEEKNKKVLVG